MFSLVVIPSNLKECFSESGRTLMQALYNFALSYEQYKLAKWLHERKSTDFNKE